jgi:hypothetical protein
MDSLKARARLRNELEIKRRIRLGNYGSVLTDALIKSLRLSSLNSASAGLGKVNGESRDKQGCHLSRGRATFPHLQSFRSVFIHRSTQISAEDLFMTRPNKIPFCLQKTACPFGHTPQKRHQVRYKLPTASRAKNSDTTIFSLASRAPQKPTVSPTATETTPQPVNSTKNTSGLWPGKTTAASPFRPPIHATGANALWYDGERGQRGSQALETHRDRRGILPIGLEDVPRLAECVSVGCFESQGVGTSRIDPHSAIRPKK